MCIRDRALALGADDEADRAGKIRLPHRGASLSRRAVDPEAPGLQFLQRRRDARNARHGHVLRRARAGLAHNGGQTRAAVLREMCIRDRSK